MIGRFVNCLMIVAGAVITLAVVAFTFPLWFPLVCVWKFARAVEDELRRHG